MPKLIFGHNGNVKFSIENFDEESKVICFERQGQVHCYVVSWEDVQNMRQMLDELVW